MDMKIEPCVPKLGLKTLNRDGSEAEWVDISSDLYKSGGSRGLYSLVPKQISLKEHMRYAELSALKGERSVMKVQASAYLFLCCFYNCCCCFLPRRLVGPLCPKAFCCPYAYQCEIKMRRDRWLGFAHLMCFIIHSLMAYASFSAGYGKPMEVPINRIKPRWNNTGSDGYRYEVVQDFEIRLDTLTASFFMLSAIFHFIWVVPSWFSPVLWSYMTSYIDDCFCPWYAVDSHTQSTCPHN